MERRYVSSTLALLLVFAGLLWLDWRRRMRIARYSAVALALLALWFFQPSAHRAWRRAYATPPVERVTALPRAGGQDSLWLSEFQSGATTMREAMIRDAGLGTIERSLSLAVLVWLAISPVLRPASSRVREPAPADLG